MKDSLKNLLGKYPYFFQKHEDSNFYKSQYVTNQRFKDVYQTLFDLVESLHLNKRCLVWKVQNAPYVYTINFVANFPNLKSVTLYKNDVEIYSESFTYEEAEDSFEYSYEGNTLNDGYIGTTPVIPNTPFKIVVETWDEYIISKGFPENDSIQGNVYDHDESLDEIGALNNIPRKEYLIVAPELYPSTEPPYNNRASEDDYHYIKRMLEYNQRIHTDSPILSEIWKLYGINATLTNREEGLIKFFDLEKHPNFKNPDAPGDGWFSGTLNSDGTITPWTPEPWEHQDKFCDYSQYGGLYFFITCSTNIPTRKQIVDLIFSLINGAGKNVEDNNYMFDIYIDDVLVKRNYTDWTYQIYPSQLSEYDETNVRVDCKDSLGKIIGSATIHLRIRGCNDADLYVDITNGSDSYDGKTAETAFKTIQKACNTVLGENDLIAVLEGDYTITTPINVIKSCTIICCGDVVLENTTDNRFFKINIGNQLSIQDMDLVYDDTTNTVEDGTFANNNQTNEIYVIGGSLGLPPYVPPPAEFPDLIKNLTYSNHVISYDQVIIDDYSDLNDVIYDLKYENGAITYKVFELSGDELTPEEWEILQTAVTEIAYNNKKIEYNVVGVIQND